MRVLWTTDAADDLERICDYIAASSPDTAQRVASLIVEGIESLESFPNRGRIGRAEGTRELIFATLPFVAVYERAQMSGSCEFFTVLSDGREKASRTIPIPNQSNRIGNRRIPIAARTRAAIAIVQLDRPFPRRQK